jgi:hypothetical protein
MNGLEIDGIAGTSLRDRQQEVLNVSGADISDLEAGLGLLNDNHEKNFSNTLGRVTFAKKIFNEKDCENEREKYFYNKVKSPIIYFKGRLFDDVDHTNAKAAAAIMRNISNEDLPLKMKASVEGGVLKRNENDRRVLDKTKISKIALTFTPANDATLVEPISLVKSALYSPEDDLALLKTIDVEKFNSPDFIEDSSAKMIKALKDTIRLKVKHEMLKKGLSIGFQGMSAPLDRTGAGVLMSETFAQTKKSEEQKVMCRKCGKEQIRGKMQTKCRSCKAPFSFDQMV